MTTLIRSTLYYVVIAMQLQIIISFNTIARTNPPHNIISYTLNNEDSNTNYKYNDTLNIMIIVIKVSLLIGIFGTHLNHLVRSSYLYGIMKKRRIHICTYH